MINNGCIHLGNFRARDARNISGVHLKHLANVEIFKHRQTLKKNFNYHL